MARKKLKEIPASAEDKSLVLRTDFSDEPGWKALCKAIEEPQTADNFQARVYYISDKHYEGAEVDDLLALDHAAANRSFLFVIDKTAMSDLEHPILVIDVDKQYGEPGRKFRVIPSEMWGVENNLGLANMDFEDFANNADPDGVFRGFK